MSIKPDTWIRTMAREHRMIEPFEETQVADEIISYGVSSYGYDLRIAEEFKIFTNVRSTVVDPKSFDETSMVVDYRGTECIIPPNSFALARSLEYFRIPRDILVICVGKSTYARCGIITNVTPLEPEWEGHVTLEISNTTPLPADSPLRTHPRVLLTGHRSWAGASNPENAGPTVLLHNLRAWLARDRAAMRNVVDRAAGY